MHKLRGSSVISTTNLQRSKKMINQYEVIKTLGKGAFADVKLCVDTKTKEKYAVKLMSKKFLKSQKVNSKKAIDCVMEELKVLKRLDHPNVIWLHEIIDDESKDYICLVTSWHTKGNLE